MPETKNYFQRTIGEKLRAGTLKPFQYERLKSFIEFERLPSPDDPIDYIVALGTSKESDTKSYQLRVAEIIKAGQQYPAARIIVSGARSDPSRALPNELNKGYNEAAVMAADIANGDIDSSRVELEIEATDTRGNVSNSLKMINQQVRRPQGVLFACSSYDGRRVDLYIRKYLEERGIPQEELPTYIVDGDMEETKQKGLLAKDTARQRWYVQYEWHRLAKYRRQGDL
jgi:uncharacterized SAM-binding protein YcdF (DUF218 family)